MEMPTLLTYEAYLREGRVEGRYDIIEGVRIFTKFEEFQRQDWRHQRVNGHLLCRFSDYETATGRGKVLSAPYAVIIRNAPNLQTRQPDLLFISNARLEQSSQPLMPSPMEVRPELVVEVLCGRKTLRTVQDKIEDYCSIGVEEAWLVSTQAETVQILRLSAAEIETVAVYANGQTLQSRVFPDLTMALADIFTL